MMIAEAASTPFRRILVPLGAALIVLSALFRTPAQAEPRTFVLDAHQGYGIADCFVDGTACGKIVADSWCESQGLGAALAFGRASDITGSIAAPKVAVRTDVSPKPAPDAILVTCAE